MNKKNSRLILNISLILMTLFLFQSNTIRGVNLSYSDIFLILTLFYLSIISNIKIPRKIFFFIIILILCCSFTSLIYLPIFFGINISWNVYFIEIIKLIILFLYLIMGYNIPQQRLTSLFSKIIPIAPLILALISFFTILNPNFYRDIFYYGSFRFKGLMNDPNYFTIMQVSSLPFILYNQEIKYANKILFILLISFSVILSGSKTGFIILIIYFLFKVLDYTVKKKNIFIYCFFIIFLLGIILFRKPIFTYIIHILEIVSDIIPSFTRVKSLIMNFSENISANGSERTLTWTSAINLIRLSPFFGVGIGTYLTINTLFFNTKLLAHNTYLQVAAEWGIPLFTICIFYIAYILIRSYKNSKIRMFLNSVLDSIIIFLLGSFGISLNNSRLWWLLIGLLIALNFNAEKNNYIRE